MNGWILLVLIFTRDIISHNEKFIEYQEAVTTLETIATEHNKIPALQSLDTMVCDSSGGQILF